MNNTARLNIVDNEWMKACRRSVLDPAHSYSPNTFAVFFSTDHYQCLVLGFSTTNTLFQPTQICLIDLDLPR
jgi:hypothetical protein